MELVAGLDTQIFVIFLGVVVALGCTLIAFLVDFLKGKNERLREQVLEMTVRQEERARQPQLQMDSSAVIGAIAQVGRNLELVVRSAINPESSRESVAPPVIAQEPVFHPRPVANLEIPPLAPAVQPEPVVAAEPIAPMVTTDVVTPEPDWRIASWHDEIAPASAPMPEPMPVSVEEVAAVVATPNNVRESLRNLFDSPASLARASQIEMERRQDEAVPEAPVEAPVEQVETPVLAEEPVVRIRVMSDHVTPVAQEIEEEVAASVVEQEEPVVAFVVEEPRLVDEAVPEVESEAHVEAIEETVALEVEPMVEEMPIAAPVGFLTAADLEETPPPAPHELSFDSLMGAVTGENHEAEPQETAAAVEPESPGTLALPCGMNDRATLDFLKRDKALFTGLIVSIGINDYARLQETSGRPAAEELAKSVSQLVKSLITASNGSEYFGCRASDDEFIVVFAGENGSVAQRRLNGLSERLWDFQLRSLGNFSVMFSWGATEAVSETFAEAVEAASERMRETRHNRRTISMEKTRLKKVVNG